MTWMNRKFSDAFGLSLALVLATVLSSRLEAQSEAVSINPPMTFALNDLALSVLSERQGNRITNVNVVGYVDIDIPPGFSMIANHLTRRDNSVGDLFPGVPEGQPSTNLTRFRKVSRQMNSRRALGLIPTKPCCPAKAPLSRTRPRTLSDGQSWVKCCKALRPTISLPACRSAVSSCRWVSRSRQWVFRRNWATRSSVSIP